MSESANKAHLARENLTRCEQAIDNGHLDHIKQAATNSDFYLGKQWNDEDKAALDADGRPALTLNMVLPTVNAIIGEQLERKMDISFKAGPGGSEPTAFALNAVMRALLAANRFDDTEEIVFSDGVITDRGYYDVRLDFEHNIAGDIKITSEDTVDVIPDPEARDYDPKTWNEVFITRWMTPDEIGITYGEKYRKLIESRAETGMMYNDANYRLYRGTFGDEPTPNDDGKELLRIRRVRVIERQFFEFTKQFFFVDLATGDLRPIPHNIKEDEVAELAAQHGVGWVKRPSRRVRIRTSCDDVLLYDDWSIYRSFTIVPFYPYFRRGKPLGVVTNLIDPQQLLNKTSSQELHIVNTTANSGWVVEEGSLVDMEADELESRGAQTGLVLEYRRNYSKPEKITPNQIPTGIERISQKAAATIRDVSSISSSMLGTARADQSGKAQQTQIARGQVQVSVILNNLLRSRRILVEKMLEIVQDHYTETRYFSMSGVDDMFGLGTAEPVTINDVDDDGNILNDVTLGKYTMEVTHAPAGGSQQDAQMHEALTLREQGVQIPDHVVVQYSNLEKKAELAEFLKNAQGFGEKTPEQQQMEDMQREFAIRDLELELQTKSAKVQSEMAKAADAMSKAQTREGFNEMRVHMDNLQLAYDKMVQDMSLRIALAARSHTNAQNLNDKRIASQVMIKAMDATERQEDKTPNKKEEAA